MVKSQLKDGRKMLVVRIEHFVKNSDFATALTDKFYNEHEPFNKKITKKEAEGFYAVHKEKPFFGELTDYMCSGPVVVSVLEGENAIKRYREIMGATNPANAEEGTIRKTYAKNLQCNSVHGSDAPETAVYEISYFFNALEIV